MNTILNKDLIIKTTGRLYERNIEQGFNYKNYRTAL